MPNKRIIVGTRGSLLALKQAEEVIYALKRYSPAVEFVIKTITTRGDKDRNFFPCKEGIFVKEIEDALLKGVIDVAVHSLKDLPVQLPQGLILCAVPRRMSSFDVFASKKRCGIRDLKTGSVVGTSSLRRKTQVLAFRKDLRIVELRGNIDTRLRKLTIGKVDGIICAFSAFQRLGIKGIGKILLPPKFIPAPGQGALGIEAREQDRSIRSIVSKIDHRPTHICVREESEFLTALGGGCRFPLGALARIKESSIRMEGFVASSDAQNVIYVAIGASLKRAAGIGRALSKEALIKGARRILREVQ